MQLRTLDTYLIVAQDSRCVWQWTRGKNGEWPEKPLVTEEYGDVEVTAVGASLSMTEIYRGVS